MIDGLVFLCVPLHAQYIPMYVRFVQAGVYFEVLSGLWQSLLNGVASYSILPGSAARLAAEARVIFFCVGGPFWVKKRNLWRSTKRWCFEFKGEDLESITK